MTESSRINRLQTVFSSTAPSVNGMNDNNVPQRPTFSVDEKHDENGTKQRPTFSMNEKQKENDSAFSSASGKNVSE